MPTALLSRDEIVARLLGVFQRRGYDGASLGEISRVTGLGRSSLYHHFPDGKEGMARAVLARINAWMEQHVLAALLSEGTPRQRLERMLAALQEFYAGGRNACVLANLIVGESRHLFRREIKDSFEAWIKGLETMLTEAGVPPRLARERAEDTVLRLEGALVLSGGLDDPAPFQRAVRHVPAELLAGTAGEA